MALRYIGTDSRGHTLSVEDNEVGGKRYWSDEIGGGVVVWDTSLVSREMLELALKAERNGLQRYPYITAHRTYDAGHSKYWYHGGSFVYDPNLYGNIELSISKVGDLIGFLRTEKENNPKVNLNEERYCENYLDGGGEATELQELKIKEIYWRWREIQKRYGRSWE